MSGGDRAEFLDIWQQHVTRPGSEKLLDWLPVLCDENLENLRAALKSRLN